MRRTIVIAFAAVTVAACGGPDVHDVQSAPSASPSASPDTVGLVMDTPTACAAVDSLYTTLDSDAQEQITKGMRAEMQGDKAGVKKALLALRPLFASTSATFTDTASKVQDPDLKAALTALAQAAAKEAAFDSFDDFKTLASTIAPAEATLKEKCAAAGYALKNVE